MTEFFTIIGLEIHTQLQTSSKLFCSCTTNIQDLEPNEATCPVCLGHPGTLPMLNEKAIEKAIIAGRSIDSDISDTIKFDRKHYYYPDLPKNFQITQHDKPICKSGVIDNGDIEVQIRSAHIEEDPGSITYPSGDIRRSNKTLIDYNRSGIPLMEFVTEPVIESPEEARQTVEELIERLDYLNVIDSSNSSAVRVDANISVETNEDQKSSRTEIKNIGSPSEVEDALSYEVTRQRDIIRKDEDDFETTRHWDESKGVTVELRKKESDSDYRHFREYDIPSIQTYDVDVTKQ
jgi:aspartyl-tRNA(Asn)/glutamyl-tRNA(Gln) amidotransferase subunit B